MIRLLMKLSNFHLIFYIYIRLINLECEYIQQYK